MVESDLTAQSAIWFQATKTDIDDGRMWLNLESSQTPSGPAHNPDLLNCRERKLVSIPCGVANQDTP